jgi:hypothetical protein
VQDNLVRRLGLAAVIGEATLEKYMHLFDTPLSQSHVRALAALFGFDGHHLKMTKSRMML